MIFIRSRWIVAAALGSLLLACDGAREAPDNVSTNTPEPVAAEADNQATGGESIIREDVLNETQVPEAPKVEPVRISLDFAEAEGELPQQAAAKLDALLKEPVVERGGCIIVRAHTDSRGSDEQNIKVSERRAALVGDYLVERGVAKERLRLIALGERRPIAPNAHPDGSDYPEGRAKNRRVTVEARPREGGAADPCGGGGR